MGKKNTKKQVKKIPAKSAMKKTKFKNKLDPGKKYCKNCRDVMPIHQKYVASAGTFIKWERKKKILWKA